MAFNLSEYVNALKLDPHSVNDGTWYARGLVHHDGKQYAAGVKLPGSGEDGALTNGEVAQLLEVNALTSVAPKTDDVVAPQATTHQDGNTVDENGNPVQQ